MTQEAAALLKSYRCARCYSDRFSGDWVASIFRTHRIQIVYNGQSASLIFIEFLLALNSGKVQLLDQGRRVSQFCALERRNARQPRRGLRLIRVQF